MLGIFFLQTHNTSVYYTRTILSNESNIPRDLLNDLTNSIRDLLIHGTILLRRIWALETRAAELLLHSLETFVEVVTVVGSADIVVGVVIHDEEGEDWDFFERCVCLGGDMDGLEAETFEKGSAQAL